MGDDRPAVMSASTQTAAPSLCLPLADSLHSMTWDPQTYRRLEASALGLFEVLRAESGDSVGEGSAEDLLADWQERLFPGGGASLLDARLAWDGLDRATASARLASRPLEVERSWSLPLEEALSECAAVAEELRSGALPEADLLPEEPPPFFQLWVPVVRWASQALESSPVSLSGAARGTLQSQLLRALSSVGAMAVYELLQTPLATESPIDLMAGLLDQQLKPLFETYPVLARQVVELATSWQASHIEWLGRLQGDLDALGAKFGETGDEIVALGLGLSDRHAGGRQVVDVRLSGGVRLAYKPRDTGLEAAWHGLLSWLTEEGLGTCPSAPAVLQRDGYGWIEWVEHWQPADLAEAERYFRGAGATLALSYLVSASDLHNENALPGPSGPVLIDGEAFFQPVDALAGGRDVLQKSFLSTGLLSFHQIDAAGEVCDVGGLCGRGGYLSTSKKRRWVQTDEPGMRPVYEEAFAEPGDNVLWLDGSALDPADFKAEMKAGFEECYRFLLARRDELLAGPLAALEGMPTRLVLRPTYLYGALQYRLATPEYQRDGLRRGFLVDALNRAFEPLARQGSQPALWPLVAEERESLERLDVPYFTAPVESTTVRSREGVAVEGHLVKSGLEVVRERIGALSPAHLETQLRLFDLALDAPPRLDLSVVPESIDISRLTELAPVEQLVAEGVRFARVADQLQGMRPPESLDEIALYSGTLGVAVALAASAPFDAAARVRAGERIAEARQALPHVEIERLGALNGVGSIVFGGVLLAELLGDAAGLALAKEATERITEDLIADDDSFDLEGGAAGAVVALLALYEASAETRWLDLASQCGRHLLASAESVPPSGGEPSDSGLAWRVGGTLTTGFVHGAGGIAVALTRLGIASGDKSFLAAAERAAWFEHSRYDRAHRNWKLEASRSPEPVFMTAWCQGGAGIALSRALLLDEGLEPRDWLEDDLARGVEAVQRADLAPIDHLCCGNLGRAEILDVCGESTSRQQWLDGARARAALVTKRAQLQGHFMLSEDSTSPKAQPPGFFRGLSGVAYQLLRLAQPRRLPSVLAFRAKRYAEDEARSVGSSREESSSVGSRGTSRTVTDEGIQYRALDAATAKSHAPMTFPAYRHLLELEPTTRHVDENDTREVYPFAIGAFAGDQLVGMSLGEIPLDPESHRGPELLSVLVKEPYRKQGVGTRLVASVERIVCNNGFASIRAVYMTGKPAIPWVERILAGRGWSEPEGRMITVRFTPESLKPAPWLEKFSRPRTHYEVFDWKDLEPEERETLQTSHAESPWIAEDLLPWKHDEHGFDEATSVGMRYKGVVVGWVIAHRLEPTVLRYTCSYMRKDLSRMARILPLYCESFSRLEGEGIETAMYATPLRHQGMIRFANKWFKPWSVFFGETRGSEKQLPDDPASLA
ncbi:MAG: type 2 lanthipeptide synthetase LanM [Acidobacteriota bacterium]